MCRRKNSIASAAVSHVDSGSGSRQTRTLTPFAIYCLIAGLACTIRFGFF